MDYDKRPGASQRAGVRDLALSEETLVTKVEELMSSLDDVKRYRELSCAMIDFGAIILGSVVAVMALVYVQSFYDVFYGVPVSNGYITLGATDSFPISPGASIATVLIVLLGIVLALHQVRRRVNRVSTGEWMPLLKEGAPGAIKLLSDTDWDSLQERASSARASYLLYELWIVAGYTILLFAAIYVFGSVVEFWAGFQSSFLSSYLLVISALVVLILERKNFERGFEKLRALDALFWDLRWFASEFKGREFGQA